MLWVSAWVTNGGRQGMDANWWEHIPSVLEFPLELFTMDPASPPVPSALCSSWAFL